MLVSVASDLNTISYKDEDAVRKLVYSSIDNYLNDLGKKLDEVILPYSKVIIKPNLVMDRNGNKDIKENPLDCFITNWNVIFAFLEKLNTVQGLDITIAECPMQWCNIDRIVTDTIKKRLKSIYKYSEVKFLDLRKYKYVVDNKGHLSEIVTSYNETVDIVLNEDSLLPKTKRETDKFRIMDYPLKGMRKYHDGSKHIYQFDKIYLDCDYIISIPKLKTHMKAGMTGAMKNFVGSISDKQCIPHHSKGSSKFGGDCYKGVSVDKIIGEFIYDIAYSFIEKNPRVYDKLRKVTNKGIIGIRRKLHVDDNISGSWYGNRTLPKAIVDINRAIIYGGLDGKLHLEPQRKIFTLMDCIVIGEGNGPLAPSPHAMGTIIFSDDCAMADMVASTLIGFDYRKIHYLKEEYLGGRYPIIHSSRILLNDCNMQLSDLKEKRIIKAMAPKYWKGHIENE